MKTVSVPKSNGIWNNLLSVFAALALTFDCMASDGTELADIRSTVIANAETWRRFDLLMRSEIFVLNSKAQVERKLGSRTIFTRLAVDFDNEQCFCFMSGTGQDSDERFDRIGICKEGTTVYREFPGGAKNLQPGALQLLHHMFIPDLRCLSLCDYPNRYQTDASRGGFERQRMMGAHTGPVIANFKVSSSQVRNAIELTLEEQDVAFKVRYNPKSNMPMGFKSFRSSSLPWILENQEDYEWEERDGIFLPIEVGRDSAESMEIEGKQEPYRKSEIVQIHWLSLNQPLDPKLFELSTVNDMSKLRKLIDPELCGAERLK